MCFLPWKSSGPDPKKGEPGTLRSITFISSIATRVGAIGYFVYAASKGAVNSMSLSLAVELAPAVRVNAILPGIIETQMTQEYFTKCRLHGVLTRWASGARKTWLMLWNSCPPTGPLDHGTGDCRGWRPVGLLSRSQ